MSGLIEELRILCNKSNLFSDSKIQYVIPLYQRAFAWNENEISQLIEDINDFTEENYYIGSLIVAKKTDYFEVIDGQQRLTSLYLLLQSLGIEGVMSNLSFACRDKSNYTLHNINNLQNEERIETTLINGKKIIGKIINENTFNQEHFKRQLKKVKLFRIQVPENTDLNRYFEIMNTRGEQLEQHDILKATLMSAISSSENKALFAKIWNACSDMTGYVQMHFDTQTRKDLFGSDWTYLEEISLTNKKVSNKNKDKAYTIESIIDPKFSVDKTDGVTDAEDRIRFKSIISFPFFLLHVLKVLMADKNKKIAPSDIVPSLLDDKKLCGTFNTVVSTGSIKGKSILENKELFSLEFIICLLKCRFLFDKYIIKREYVNENSDGEWSLKELKVSGQASNKKPYYTNTYFGRYGEWAATYAPRHEINLMLQSCLRVSYTSPKVMHWITTLLKWIYNDENLDELNNYECVIESTARLAIKKDFFNNTQENDFNYGTYTPHIVFNYLDYLLWKNFRKSRKDYANFVFEFRNSVEHWYPQTPSEGTFEKWLHEDGLDSLGNLCLIQSGTNSKFSNMIPEAKASTFVEMISKGSLKLRIMSEIIQKSSSQKWKGSACKSHQDEMIEILKRACGLLGE